MPRIASSSGMPRLCSSYTRPNSFEIRGGQCVEERLLSHFHERWLQQQVGRRYLAPDAADHLVEPFGGARHIAIAEEISNHAAQAGDDPEGHNGNDNWIHLLAPHPSSQ